MTGWDLTSVITGASIGALLMFAAIFLLCYLQDLADREPSPKPEPKRTAGDIVKEKSRWTE